jgi:hypothetical protein
MRFGKGFGDDFSSFVTGKTEQIGRLRNSSTMAASLGCPRPLKPLT